MAYCLVYHSTTKGRASHVEGRFAKKSAAIVERDRHNRTAMMGGFYNVHLCSRLKNFGLGKRKR